MHCQLAVLMAKKNPRMTQRELARALEVSHTTINKLHNGRPMTSTIKPEIVEKLCDFFECEIQDLFTLVEESAPPEAS